MPAAVKVTTLVLVGPEMPADGLQVYCDMATVDVKPTVTFGEALKQVILGLLLLKVNVGALVFGDTATVAAAAEQPLAAVAIKEKVTGLELVTCAVFDPELNIDPPEGAIQV